MGDVMIELQNLDRHLRETFSTHEAIQEWIDRPSPYLGGLTPAGVMRAGRPDRVEAALEALDSGVFI